MGKFYVAMVMVAVLMLPLTVYVVTHTRHASAAQTIIYVLPETVIPTTEKDLRVEAFCYMWENMQQNLKT